MHSNEAPRYETNLGGKKGRRKKEGKWGGGAVLIIVDEGLEIVNWTHCSRHVLSPALGNRKTKGT